MHAVVINLPQEKKRRNYMENQLNELGLSFLIKEAFLPEKIPSYLEGFFFNEDGQPWENELIPGEIGAYASHLDVMRKVKDGIYPSPLLVLEDDVVINRNSLLILKEIYNISSLFPDDFHCVNFFHIGYGYPLAKLKINKGLYLMRNIIPSWGAYCYIITQQGAELFYNFKSVRKHPIDQDWAYASLTKNFKIWEPNMTLIHHNDSFVSNIDPLKRRNNRKNLTYKYIYKYARYKYGYFRYKIYKFKKWYHNLKT